MRKLPLVPTRVDGAFEMWLFEPDRASNIPSLHVGHGGEGSREPEKGQTGEGRPKQGEREGSWNRKKRRRKKGTGKREKVRER